MRVRLGDHVLVDVDAYGHIVIQERKTNGPPMDWLVECHIRAHEATTKQRAHLAEDGHVPDIPAAHLYYIITEAGPTMFVLPPECRRLADIDPRGEP